MSRLVDAERDQAEDDADVSPREQAEEAGPHAAWAECRGEIPSGGLHSRTAPKALTGYLITTAGANNPQGHRGVHCYAPNLLS